MRTLFFTIIIALMGYCIATSWDMPSKFYKHVHGTVVDKYRSIEGQQQRSYTDYTDHLVLAVRYPSGVELEIVDPNTYYNYQVGEQISFTKENGDNWAFDWRVIVSIICIISMIVAISTYEKPKPVVKVKAKFPGYNFNDED